MTVSKVKISEWIADDPVEPSVLTIGDMLIESARKWPDKEALVYSFQPEIGDIRMTYKELNDRTTNIAKGFLEAGYISGEAIAIWGPNHPEWILAEYGLAKAGLKLITLNPLYKKLELEYTLNSSEAVAIIHADQIGANPVISQINEVKELVKSLRGVYSFSSGLSEIEESGKRSSRVLPNVNSKDIFMIQYTSGTTGNPKAAQMPHSALVTTAKNSHKRWQIGQGHKVCHGFPLFHIGGSACMTLGAAATGAVSLPLYIFKPDVTLNILQNERCSIFIGAPVLLTAMLEVPNFNEYDLSSLKCLVVGGSNPPIELLKKFSEAFKADVINGYGMTETCGLTSTALPNDPPELKAIAGLALPGVSLKVVNDEYKVVENDVPGELLYKGPGLMQGYGNLPDGSSGINSDGWFPTGDLATMNKDGYINIVGRAKEMIIRGGENLYPIEIENYLLEHPGVLEVAVIGLPDKKYDEECCAVVRVDSESLTEPQELKEWCKDRISRWKIPRYIFFVSSFPITPSGKIQKYKLQEQYISELNLN